MFITTRRADEVRSAVNSAATKFELVHYISISEPAIVATDAALLDTVQAALDMSALKLRPKIVLLDHKQATSSSDGPAPVS